MQCIKLAVAFLIVFSGNIFASDLNATSALTQSNKIYQSGASTNNSTQLAGPITAVVQGGVHNQAVITQQQPGSQVSLKQSGNNNRTDIKQTASYDIANIDQAGMNNTITTTQNSGNSTVDIQQDGATSNSDITIRQGSSDAGIDAGGMRTAHVQQIGATGSTVNITQESASAAFVNQSGSQNSVTIVQR